jgi:hypothetical protein
LAYYPVSWRTLFDIEVLSNGLHILYQIRPSGIPLKYYIFDNEYTSEEEHSERYPRYYVNISDHTGESGTNSPSPRDDGNRFINAFGKGSEGYLAGKCPGSPAL